MTKKKEKAEITEIKNESGNIFTDSSEIKCIIRKQFEKLYDNYLGPLWQNGIDWMVYKKQTKNYFSQFWKVGSLRLECQLIVSGEELLSGS